MQNYNTPNKSIMIVLGILLSFILMILFYNTDNLMVKMGFETKSVIKDKLSLSNQRVDQLVIANNKLSHEFEVRAKSLEAAEQELSKLKLKQQESLLVVADIKLRRDKAVKVVYKTPSVIGKHKPTVDDVEDTTVSEANIIALHAAHAALFNS